jgi:Zn-dependent M28 family amino/carboxypeptidase
MDRVRAHIAELASDAYEGRAPATAGGNKSEAYLADQMKAAGIMPGNGDSYFQAVPMVSIALNEDRSSVEVVGGAVDLALTFGEEIVYHTRQVKEAIRINDSDLVFVGYGIVAPEYDHDDYAGIDVTGKTVVMLVNDPGFITEDPSFFNGKAMTYYGRWTYKYEEASRQGAAAALIIHQTAPAAYGWNVVEEGWSGPQFDLVREDGYAGRVKMEGWITEKLAKDLFQFSGLDFAALTKAAQSPEFQAVPMGNMKLNASLNSKFEYVTANNVIGKIEGSKASDEAVLYMAHFDHLGVKNGGKAGEDVVFNGAVDNATGTAAILAIGEAFAAAKKPPKRSVIIAAVTAEESGLLGSAYFAENPVMPLSKIVGGMNIDAIIPTGPARDIVVTGLGSSELEDILSVHAEREGLTLSPESSPEAGLFYRSDHISLAKKGVPMLYLDGGQDLIDGGLEAGIAAGKAYYAGPYHNVGDEYDPNWNFGTIEQVTSLAYNTGNALARSAAWPNWYDGSEFKALRDAMRAAQTP